MNDSRPGIPGLPMQPVPQRNAPHPPQARTPNSYNAPHPPPIRPGVVPAPPVRTAPAVVPPATHVPTEKELEPLTLIEEAGETAAAAAAPKKILAFGADLITKKHEWKRTPIKTGTGAIRVKSFHGKYSDQGLEYLDNAINEWLDASPEVEVKFVTSTVMTFEGKIREPALVLNVWY